MFDKRKKRALEKKTERERIERQKRLQGETDAKRGSFEKRGGAA